MTSNPINPPLPADLPTNWTFNQIVAPNGSEVGMAEQYGYNYLMQQVNAAQRGVNSLGKGMEDLLPWSLASNENLLINWYFADPINQRGQTEYADAGYTIDRWHIGGGSQNIKYNVSENTLSCTYNKDRYSVISQFIETPANLAGVKLTLSCLFEEMKKAIIQIWKIDSSNKVVALASSGSWENDKSLLSISLTVPSNILNTDKIRIIIQTQEKIKVVAAKLELGDHQTLAHPDANGNWVLNDPPPDKALELAKCQRYYISFNEGIYPSGYITNSALEYYANLSLPVPLRTYPSLVGTPAFTVRLPTGGYSSRFPIGTATADSYRLGGYAANCISLVGIINAAVDPNNIPISLKVMPFALDAELY